MPKYEGNLNYKTVLFLLGLPKPALFAQDRALRATCLMAMAGVHENDVIYTALPLYHSSGLGIALGTTARLGEAVVLYLKLDRAHIYLYACIID